MLDEHIPILSQLPNNFKSAAILLHPFVEMPLGWEQLRRQSPYEHIYPSDEDILKHGKPVSWEIVVHDNSFKNIKELAIALISSIGAFRKEYARTDLVEKLNLKTDIYYPSEDSISVFLIGDLLKVLSSNGANSLFFSEPILDKSGALRINDTTTLEISEITDSELILSDENINFAFMSIYDSFITLFIAKDKNINDIVQSMNWEAIICDDETKIDWYW